MLSSFKVTSLLIGLSACFAAHTIRRAKTVSLKIRVFGDDPKVVFLKAPEKGDTKDTSAWYQYWNQPAQSGSNRRPATDVDGAKTRYLTFETDAGGFNNMRMAFEYFVDLAVRSNRTLVLPPPEGWYLIDWGPLDARNKNDKHWLDGSPESSYQEFWDIKYLSKKMSVISADEFFAREKARFAIPETASPTAKMVNSPDPSPWKQWLETQRCASSCTQSEQVALEDAQLVHLGCDRSRYLMCLYGEVATPDNGKTARSMIHYNPKMFDIASIAVARMGASGYTALHLRRNDFQFVQAPSADNLAVLLGSLEEHMKPGEPVYVASDEIHEEWWQALQTALKAKDHTLFRLEQFRKDLEKAGLTSRNEGLVEQIICAGARTFVGTPQSTFTEGINMIRSNLADAYASNTPLNHGTEFQAGKLFSALDKRFQ
eukprot:TRINITY_DN30180_c0_g4_i1.p1 TRINITY_DN30180_c0_g4~~TRINITY_DN30180_c0_g4_i1.p1  ORF type:complete len:429 (+),score=81.43 TRINITY_DN30180_c0_g4_i1:53-1339(+)